MKDRVVVMGVSAGGMQALGVLFKCFTAKLNCPILIVQHLGDDGGEYLCQYLDDLSIMHVRLAEDKMQVVAGEAYVAPGGYHMLLDEGMRLALSVEDRVCYARPSVDVLFQSASDLCGAGVIGVILTGANSDGAEGIKSIKQREGLTLAQDPQEATSSVMPTAAIQTGCVDEVLPLVKIAEYLQDQCGGGPYCRLSQRPDRSSTKGC